jgi:hypothetical protein
MIDQPLGISGQRGSPLKRPSPALTLESSRGDERARTPRERRES